MKSNIIVVDNFYIDVDNVRNFALNQQFNVSGNYPGNRTKSFITDSAKSVIQRIIEPHAGLVTNWHDLGDKTNYTGAYQLCLASDKTWIHADIFNTWSAVCYLTPDAPLNSGTCFYKHKQTNQLYYINSFHDGTNYDDWEQSDYVANVYNRIVFFRGALFHAAVNYFGDSLYNGRLFQTFFFDTQY